MFLNLAQKSQKNSGFTLIELVVVIAVIFILIIISFFSYRSFEEKTELESTAQNILINIKLAQNKTLSSEEASQYGIHFENDKYVLFKGNTYDPGSPNNKIYLLSNQLEINQISLNGNGNEIIFQRINGKTEQYGDVSIRLVSQPAQKKTIKIWPSGQIELEPGLPACCLNNRITDTRHLHLNLGWSIQSSLILTLYFPDFPEVSKNINMIDYFNVSKTEFSWQGEINVNGQTQKLYIHTHFLDDLNTILCIHRDRDKNNKPLQILIDGKDIISYTTAGEISIGFFGGIPEIQ